MNMLAGMDRRRVWRRGIVTCAVVAMAGLFAVSGTVAGRAAAGAGLARPAAAGASGTSRAAVAATTTASAALLWKAPVAIDHAAGPHKPGVTGRSCPSRHLCFGVDATGDVVRLSGALATGRGQTLTGADPIAGFVGVSCPSRHLCVGIDEAGRVLSTTRPGVAAPWKAVVLGAPEEPAPLSSITCPSTSLCLVVDDDSVLASTHPTGGRRAWRTVVEGNGEPMRVACPSPRLCVGINEGNSSEISIPRHPAQPSSWQFSWERAQPRGPLVCPTIRVCVSVALARSGLGVFYTTHLGHGWRYARLGSGRRDARSLACLSARVCLVGGDSGDVMRVELPRRAGGPVRLATSTIASSADAVGALACPDPALCLAGDSAGQTLVTVHPRVAGAWRVAHTTTPPKAALLSVTCASLTACVAGDDVGAILTSAGPGGPWARRVIDPGHALGAVACTSAMQCFAGDSAGRLLATGPGGPTGPWQITAIPHAGSINSLSCSAATQCVAGDFSGGLLSPDPTDAAPQWSAFQPDSSEERTNNVFLACPAVNECAAAYLSVQTDASSEYLAASGSTDPATSESWGDAPQAAGGRGLPTAISCTSTPVCVATTNSGQVVTNPGALSRPFHAVTIDPGHQLTGVVCSTTGRCVAVDEAGGVFESDNPNGDASAWPRVAGLRAGLDAIACPTSSTCVAVDRYGRAAVGASPS
jgi:hypothetical protein